MEFLFILFLMAAEYNNADNDERTLADRARQAHEQEQMISSSKEVAVQTTEDPLCFVSHHEEIQRFLEYAAMHDLEKKCPFLQKMKASTQKDA